MADSCNPNTQRADTGGSPVEGHSDINETILPVGEMDLYMLLLYVLRLFRMCG